MVEWKKKRAAKACGVVDIGGQAVMEGVMMKAPRAIAVAVRKPDGSVAVEDRPYTPLSERHKWMGWPFVRGCVNMVVMLKMGMETLSQSTRMLGIMEEEPSKFEKWLARKLGKSIDKIVMTVAAVLAVALSVFLFVMLPSVAGTLINQITSSPILVNLISGLVRIAILVAYIWLMGQVPDMRRVFQYHGAEHKTVYCHEHGQPLTPQNARRYSTLHPRCGTSFLLLVMMISILVGAVADQLILLVTGLARLSYPVRLLRSLLLIPILTGISFEALKGLAHADTPLVRALRWPGLMMQKLTTREPDDDMLQVAIVAMQTALARSAEVEAARGGGAPAPVAPSEKPAPGSPDALGDPEAPKAPQ
ncbi:MAG: DUF1385 domain-containing protein [Oscillospiraceae bacterium]|jgi:uncharacterized protein YqhQ|nr:DUF1385 domain-containing protein [Oscillospiraceae bacterium]